MAVTAAVASGITAVATVGGGIEQRKASKTSARAEKSARQLENRKAALVQQRQKQRQVADLRIARARQEAGAEAGGVAGSSSVQGAIFSSTSQAAGNIGFAETQFRLGAQAAGIRSAGARSANRSLSRASTFGDVAAVSSLFGDPTRNEALSTG